MDELDPWSWRLGGEEHALAAWLFVRAIGAVYLIAFLSLAPQVRALIGKGGIHPIAERLPVLGGRARLAAFLKMPTLCWFARSDRALTAMVWTGALVSLAAALGVAPLPALGLAWLLYLSLFHACDEFLGYQWDVLLLECGVIAMLLAPAELASFRPVIPPAPAIALGWFLLFRLMFGSGWSKIASGDRTWRSLTALVHHYQTQPLPTPLAWYVHHLPRPVHRIATALALAIELPVPFLLFAPSALRAAAAIATAGLMVAIAATGNFAFFNLLTVALCVLAIDDVFWARVIGAVAPDFEVSARQGALLPDAAMALVVAPLFVLGALVVARQIARRRPLPRPLAKIVSHAAAFALGSPYGLFAVMTTERPEIVIEGSNDGRTWKAYELRHKPGDPRRRPTMVAPHQPRLDWQLWFAALRGVRRTPWLAALARRLLEGAPEVLRLFRTNPFSGAPPRFVRFVVYDYRFADPASRRAQGVWWIREPLEEGPIFSLPGAPVLPGTRASAGETLP